MTDTPVMALGRWNNNAEMIADIARMGRYLNDLMTVWDASWGTGAFWRNWTPAHLTATDGDPEKLAPNGTWDAREPFPSYTGFGAVVWDPPYKLNGTPSSPDRPFGADVVDTRDGRHRLMCDGLVGCIKSARVGGWVLTKSMVQVNSGKKWNQPHMLTTVAEANGCRWADEFLLQRYRPQPAGTSQEHARTNYSTLSVFQRMEA